MLNRRRGIMCLLLLFVVVSMSTQGCLLFGGKNTSPGKAVLSAYTMTAEGMNVLKGQVIERCQSGKMKPKDCSKMKESFNQAVIVFQQAERVASYINNAGTNEELEDGSRKYNNLLGQLEGLLNIVDSFL